VKSIRKAALLTMNSLHAVLRRNRDFMLIWQTI